MQDSNPISRALMRSMVEVDARIKVSVVAATHTGLVYKGKTFDFESCEDTGEALAGEVRCKGEGGGGGGGGGLRM